MAWCAPWIALIALLLFLSQVGQVRIPYETYKFWRGIGILLLVVLAFVGILRALDIVGEPTQAVWYTKPFLVSLVLFWGLFPPSWFFLEYLLFDRGVFVVPVCDAQPAVTAVTAAEPKCLPITKAEFLPSVKTYSDLASKIWFAISAALGVAIGLARK